MNNEGQIKHSITLEDRQKLDSLFEVIRENHGFKNKYIVENLEDVSVETLNAYTNYDDSNTLLHIAVEKGNIDAIKAPADKGVDMNVAHIRSGMTPLHLAVLKGNSEVVNELLNRGG